MYSFTPCKVRRVLILLSLITIAASPGRAQIQFSLLSGYATYSMSELKDFQKELKSQFPVDAKITDSFPAYWYYELSGTCRLTPRFFTGVSLIYGSTGGRIYYADYSGRMNSDQQMNYMAVGFPVGWSVPIQENKLNLLFQMKPTVIFGNLDVAVASYINSQTQGDDIKFKSTSIGVQPSFQIERKIGPVFLDIQFGYNLNVYSSEFFFKDNKSYYLLNSKGNKVHADWSGIRAGLGVSYRLNMK